MQCLGEGFDLKVLSCRSFFFIIAEGLEFFVVYSFKCMQRKQVTEVLVWKNDYR